VAVPDVLTGVIIPPGPAPAAIAVAGDTLWVADNQDHRLYQMDRAGATSGSFDLSPQDEVYGLAWDGQDLLLALGGWDRCRLVRMSTAGSVLGSVPFPVNAIGLGWNPADSSVWTAMWDNGGTFLVHLTLEGRLVETFRPNLFGMPDGLACGPDGLWVTDSFGDVARFSYSGARLAQTDVDTGSLPQVSPAIDADGTLFLVSERNRRIYQFSTRLDAARSDPTPMPDEPGARYLPRAIIERLPAAGLPTVSIQNGFSGALSVSLDRINYSDHEAAVIQPGQTWTAQVQPGAYTIFASTSGQGMVTLWGAELLLKGHTFTWQVGPD
jgi:DNA-binding beta-propeller fold protein YncE